MADRPAQNTTVFFFHPDRSWRFLSRPLAVSLTWMLDSENLVLKNISSAQADTKLPSLLHAKQKSEDARKSRKPKKKKKKKKSSCLVG